jgi:hypothetical protein
MKLWKKYPEVKPELQTQCVTHQEGNEQCTVPKLCVNYYGSNGFLSYDYFVQHWCYEADLIASIEQQEK